MPNAVHPRVDSISPRRARWRALAGALLGATAIAGCARESASSGTSTPPRAAVRAGTGPTDPDGTRPALEERDPSAPRHAKPPRLVLAFGGDVIAHDALRVAAARADHRDAAGRSLNDSGYGALIAAIAPAVRGADLAFANLESPVTPRELRRGEMIFHADEPLLAAVARAGFHVVSVANNHALDQGRGGLADTLAAANRHGLVAVGAGETMRDACAPRVATRSGIAIAVLARTLVMNFRDPPERGSPSVCMLAEGPLKRQAREARAAGADVVIASLHWGNEYDRAPRREQIDAAHRLVEAGVDLVIGHHPHVLQRVERVPKRDGRSALVAYSLGNLLSNQGYAFDPRTGKQADGDTRDAAVLRVVVARRDDGAVEIADAAAVPLWTDHSAGGDITLVPATTRRARIGERLQIPLVDASVARR
ncbi:MAG: CapA family protein [Labilithrix sp.]|nr:CapA family protein [Labilithrix sp.]